jgi:glycosyltransferase involved in cell wall biosynthesis
MVSGAERGSGIIRSLRILALNHGHPPFAQGGLERSGQVAIEGLADRGHELLVLAGEVPLAERESRGFPGEVRNDVKVERCLPAMGPRTKGSVVQHAKRLTQDARSAKLARQSVADFNPDAILICHFASGISQVVPWALLESGLPTVIYCGDAAVQGFDRTSWLRHLAPPKGATSVRDRAVGLVVRAANQAVPQLRVRIGSGVRISMVCCSDFIRSSAQPNPDVFDVEEAVVVYMGTPHQAAIIRALETEADRNSDVVFVGRITPEKGIDVALRAMPKVIEAVPDSRLVVVGGDSACEYAHALRSLSNELGLPSGSLHFAGPGDSDELARWLVSSGAVVVPSRWDEPAGKITIESALARLPIVASRVGGIPDLMHEGSHARFFARENSEQCAEELVAALTEQSETQRMVTAGAERASGFTQDATAEVFEQLLQRAVSRRAG